MSFKIRDIEIKNNLVLAPMAGICNEAFRTICKEMGAGLVVCEMVSDKAISYQNAKTLNMTRVGNNEHPISMQIFGGDIETLVNAAKFIDNNSQADIIDINMGCPVNKVAKKAHAGASLLVDPNNVYEITKAVVSAVKKPVTVKVRLGWDLEHINVIENAKMIEKAGASAICVHARCRSEFYSGSAHIEWIKKVKEAVSIPVIGNGDVVDIASAKRMFEETNCDAIAIGRGALGNPFIFRELNAYFNDGKIIDKPTKKEIYDIIMLQYDRLLKLKGEHLAMLEMRSHVGWYLKGMPGSARIKDHVCKEHNFNNVKNIIKAYLNVEE